MHLPARLWPVGAGACEVYGSDRLHPSTVQGCVMVVRHARRQFRGQSSLCACHQCSRAAGSQQSSRARRELSQRAALRPRPAWPAPPPSWPLLAVCAAAHMQARGALRTLAPIQCLPPCLYAFRRGARDDARGSSRSSSCWSRASSSHSFHGAWATDAMATRRWNSGGAILPGSDADARVDVGGWGGWQDESYP